MTQPESFTVMVPSDPMKRVAAFFADWQEANHEAVIELRLGHTTAGHQASLLISIEGRHHAFTIPEAHILAEAMERVVERFGGAARKEGLPALAAAIRRAIFKAEVH